MEYFLILMGFLIVGVVLGRIYNLHIYHSRKQMIFTVTTILVIGTAWDYFATWRQHWIFPGNGLLGIYIYGLPIEEFFFFLIMPYFAFTIYKIYHAKIK
jgi:lycopene cyclase domain-containing protein